MFFDDEFVFVIFLFQTGKLDIVKLLIENGGCDVKLKDANGKTASDLASSNGNFLTNFTKRRKMNHFLQFRLRGNCSNHRWKY